MTEKVENRPNIVIFIVESFGREYSGAFNKDKKYQRLRFLYSFYG